jgi:hypothetical protein
MTQEIDAPGWQAIDRTLTSRYPGQIPHQFTSQVPYNLDKQSPLPAVCVWEAGSPKSWHYVSYGLTELFSKESNVPEVSGFGAELTLRLPRGDDDPHPPVWGVKLLQALAHHCFSQGAGFDAGHCVDLGSSIADDQESALTGLVCLPDPMLRKIEGPFGSLLFLQLIGLTAEELATFREMSLQAQVAAIADLDASGLTDPSRASWLADESTAVVLRRYKLGVGL